MEHGKDFIIIGSQNAITYKEIFPLLMHNRMWFGYNSGDMAFRVPVHYEPRETRFWVDDDGQKWHSMGNIRWYTNLDLKKRHEEMILVQRYSPEKYPRYANYDVIEVGKLADIPCDYAGLMGVPITFLDKYNPDQFEIIGQSRTLGRPMSEIAEKGEYVSGGVRFYIEEDASRQAGRQAGKATASAASTTGSSSEIYIPRYRRLYDRIVIRNRNPEEPR